VNATWKALKAAFAYVAVVFAVGFVLGILRTMALVPWVGETSAVLIELPPMLAVSWLACHWTVRRFAAPAERLPRLVMGGAAFGLLMAGELGVSIFAFDRTPAEHVASYGSAAARWGLSAQVVFAPMPWLQSLSGRLRFGV
jgi:hypothetical protein